MSDLASQARNMAEPSNPVASTPKSGMVLRQDKANHIPALPHSPELHQEDQQWLLSTWKHSAFACLSGPWPQKTVPKHCPKSLPFILHSNSSITFYNSLQWFPDDRQGLKLGLKLKICNLINEFYWFNLLPNQETMCMKFEYFTVSSKYQIWAELWVVSNAQASMKPLHGYVQQNRTEHFNLQLQQEQVRPFHCSWCSRLVLQLKNLW